MSFFVTLYIFLISALEPTLLKIFFTNGNVSRYHSSSFSLDIFLSLFAQPFIIVEKNAFPAS